MYIISIINQKQDYIIDIPNSVENSIMPSIKEGFANSSPSPSSKIAKTTVNNQNKIKPLKTLNKKQSSKNIKTKSTSSSKSNSPKQTSDKSSKIIKSNIRQINEKKKKSSKKNIIKKQTPNKQLSPVSAPSPAPAAPSKIKIPPKPIKKPSEGNKNYSSLKTNVDPSKPVDFEGILKKLDEEEKAYLEKKLNEKPEPPPKCNNESINEKFRYAKEYMKPFEISCDFINKEGKPDTSTPVDPMLFYKEKYKPIPLVMDDPTFRGFNVGEYSNHANIWDVGRINLKSDIEYPVPSNFTFKTSPAFRK